MKAIIFTNSNGGVSVCIPTGELSIEEVQAKDTPEGSLIVNTSDLPNQHNDFFDAWELVGVTPSSDTQLFSVEELSGPKVIVNFDKATELTKKRLRAEREPLMSAQDIAFQRALETGADTTLIVAEKQRLRNVTNFSVTTLEELKALKAEVTV